MLRIVASRVVLERPEVGQLLGFAGGADTAQNRLVEMVGLGRGLADLGGAAGERGVAGQLLIDGPGGLLRFGAGAEVGVRAQMTEGGELRQRIAADTPRHGRGNRRRVAWLM